MTTSAGMRHVHEERVESRVINEALIRGGIQIRDIAVASPDEKRQSMKFDEIQELSLSFKNLVSITHLDGLHALTKLQLDNNCIKRIQNLDLLVNLEWLDLSFNEIEKIEGLDSLKKLKDLSLFSNCITSIENMDSLTNLQILSIGNNRLTRIEDVEYLRRLKELRILKLTGNPLCQVDPSTDINEELEGYRSQVIARLNDLQSLDYKRLLTSELSESKEHHQDDLIEIAEREEKQEEIEKTEQEHIRYAALMDRANLMGVDTLFDLMENDDPDWRSLKQIPGLMEFWNEAKSKMQSTTDDFKGHVLTHLETKETETEMWRYSIDRYLLSHTQHCKQRITSFEKDKKQLLRSTSVDKGDAIMSIKSKLMQLKQELMASEEEVLHTVRHLDDQYQAALTEFNTTAMSLYATYFTQIRDMINNAVAGLNTAALSAYERYGMDGDPEKIPDIGRQLMGEKEVLLVALQNTSDFKIFQMDAIEEELNNRQHFMLERTNTELHLLRKKQNRDRITEILNYIEHAVQETDVLFDDKTS